MEYFYPATDYMSWLLVEYVLDYLRYLKCHLLRMFSVRPIKHKRMVSAKSRQACQAQTMFVLALCFGPAV